MIKPTENYANFCQLLPIGQMLTKQDQYEYRQRAEKQYAEYYEEKEKKLWQRYLDATSDEPDAEDDQWDEFQKVDQKATEEYLRKEKAIRNYFLATTEENLKKTLNKKSQMLRLRPIQKWVEIDKEDSSVLLANFGDLMLKIFCFSQAEANALRSAWLAGIEYIEIDL